MIQKPIRIEQGAGDQRFLVAADHELILSTEDATDEELGELVTAFNGEPQQPLADTNADQDVANALAQCLQALISGEHYDQRNPYCRTYVKAGLQALAKKIGFEGNWMDALEQFQSKS